MKIVTNIKSIAKKINYFIRRTPSAARSVLEDTAIRIQTRMNVRQEKSDYPVTWDSERQRRAFFATNGFGNGIPYKRTGATKFSIDTSFKNEVDLFAPHPAGAVFGMPTANFWQSRIHRQTWPVLKTVLAEELKKLPSAIMASLRVAFSESDEAP